jgi:hypothetical protein
MTKQSLSTLVLSVVLSVIASTAANLAFDRQREPVLPDVVRAKSVELIDSQGRIRATFELVKDGRDSVVPHLVMRDANGRDSIEMGVDARGNGALSFASEHWNEGAVILGHLNLVDPNGPDPETKEVDKSGAWGLQTRSPQSKYTGIGFFNSGRPIAPLPGNTQH